MNIGVVGVGYVGLVTAVCLAEIGFHIYAVEKNRDKLIMLQSAESTIYEPGLNDLLKKNSDQGRIQFTDNAAVIVNKCEIVFLCVGTPSHPDGSADMNQIEEALQEIVEAAIGIGQYRLIAVKSTVPVGTASSLSQICSASAAGRSLDLEIASNPEFLREGAAIYDFLHPDRIIMGTSSTRSCSLLEQVYESFQCPKIMTDCNTAEMIKYASNSFLATKISYINMIADLCDKVNADVTVVSRGMGYDPRIASDFLQAGIGFGGSCFPKDLRAFIHTAASHHVPFSLLEQVIAVNNNRPIQMVRQLRDLLQGLHGRKITVLGLTFKPNTDDTRESPALALIELLKKEGSVVCATDPIGIQHFANLYPQTAVSVEFYEDPVDALAGAEAAVIATDWSDYKALDWVQILKVMDAPIILDGRNMLDPEMMLSIGFNYFSVGRSHQ